MVRAPNRLHLHGARLPDTLTVRTEPAQGGKVAIQQRAWRQGTQWLALLVLSLAPLPSFAQMATETSEIVNESPPTTDMRRDAVTVNVAPAYCGVLALQWEHRFLEHVSVLLLGGGGVGSSLSNFTDMKMLEIGLQLRGYAVVTQRQAVGVGAEAMVGWLFGTGSFGRQGTAISPRIVYRLMPFEGVTVDLQAGLAWTDRRAVQVGTGARVSSTSGPDLIQAVAFGYSF